LTGVVIAGAGVRGLSCGLHLARAGHRDIRIIDIRAEPGVPTSRPGLMIDHVCIIDTLESFGIADSQSTPMMIGTGALRREWLVKSLAIAASRAGCIISSRTRLIGAQPMDEGIEVRTVGAGPLSRAPMLSDLLIVAIGVDEEPTEAIEPASVSLPDDVRIIREHRPSADLRRWHGTIISHGDQIGRRHIGVRADGTIEAWSTELMQQDCAVLERMRCLGGAEPPTVDDSLSAGHGLADAVLTVLPTAATP